MGADSELQPHDAEVAPAEDDEVPALDPEAEARRVAAMSFIRKLGDPVLKSSATPVDRFDDSLRRQVSRMAGIMEDAIGIGLAAPQLGISQRLLVYRVGPDAPLVALANPEVEWEGDEVEPGEEGCSRYPGWPWTSSVPYTCACAPRTSMVSSERWRRPVSRRA